MLRLLPTTTSLASMALALAIPHQAWAKAPGTNDPVPAPVATPEKG
jgi:hypothetical protein